MAEQPEQYTLIRGRSHTHTVSMAFVQPSLMCLFVLSVYGLLCGCDSETESDLQFDTSMASVLSLIHI